MGGIDANPYTVLVVDLFDDPDQVFKPESDVAALSGGIFDHSNDPLRLVEGHIDGFSNQADTHLFRNLVKVGSRMEIQPIKA